jgi:hypothetical protein
MLAIRIALVPDLGDKVDSGHRVAMVHVLQSTLESTHDEVIVNSIQHVSL